MEKAKALCGMDQERKVRPKKSREWKKGFRPENKYFWSRIKKRFTRTITGNTRKFKIANQAPTEENQTGPKKLKLNKSELDQSQADGR